MENNWKKSRDSAFRLQKLFAELRLALELKMSKERLTRDSDKLASRIGFQKQRILGFLDGTFALSEGKFLKGMCAFADKSGLYSLICSTIQDLGAGKKIAVCVYPQNVVAFCFDLHETYAEWVDKLRIPTFAQAFGTYADVVADVLYWSHKGFDALKADATRSEIENILLEEGLIDTLQALAANGPVDGRRAMYDELETLCLEIRPRYSSLDAMAQDLGIARNTLKQVHTRKVSEATLSKALAKARQLTSHTPRHEVDVQTDKTSSSTPVESRLVPAAPTVDSGLKEPFRLLGALLSALGGSTNAVSELVQQTGLTLRPQDRLAAARIIVQIFVLAKLDSEIINEAWQGQPITQFSPIMKTLQGVLGGREGRKSR